MISNTATALATLQFDVERPLLKRKAELQETVLKLIMDHRDRAAMQVQAQIYKIDGELAEVREVAEELLNQLEQEAVA